MNLTRLERYRLANQLRILEALYPDEAEDYAIQREALERGYEFNYSMRTDHLDADVMTEDECKEVWNTMDMFVSIGRSIEELKLEGLEDKLFTKFAGYDGNNETKFMAFAAYTVERLKRFTHLPMQEPGYFNSHMPVRPVYGRMLSKWLEIPMPNRFDMGRDALLAVLQEAIHPENR